MMLNAWHLPVPPFVKQSKDQLLITLWLTGEDPPQRIMLRTEHDNEEMSVPMHKQRSQPQPGVTAWRAAIDLSSGQPRRRYSFKLLWHDRQRWFTPQGFSRMPPARLEQFAVDVPDIGPQWAADQIFYQIFPDRFARSLPREAEQDHVYYHHAAGQEIILRDWDEPICFLLTGKIRFRHNLDLVVRLMHTGMKISGPECIFTWGCSGKAMRPITHGFLLAIVNHYKLESLLTAYILSSIHYPECNGLNSVCHDFRLVCKDTENTLRNRV